MKNTESRLSHFLGLWEKARKKKKVDGFKLLAINTVPKLLTESGGSYSEAVLFIHQVNQVNANGNKFVHANERKIKTENCGFSCYPHNRMVSCYIQLPVPIFLSSRLQNYGKGTKSFHQFSVYVKFNLT